MSTCKDCIHYEICEIMSDQYGISKVPSCQCGFYTPDVVEVVRCRDCKHYDSGTCNHFGYYTYAPDVDEDDYCSYGERRKTK